VLPTTNYQSPTTNHQLPTINNQKQITIMQNTLWYKEFQLNACCRGRISDLKIWLPFETEAKIIGEASVLALTVIESLQSGGRIRLQEKTNSIEPLRSNVFFDIPMLHNWRNLFLWRWWKWKKRILSKKIKHWRKDLPNPEYRKKCSAHFNSKTMSNLNDISSLLKEDLGKTIEYATIIYKELYEKHHDWRIILITPFKGTKEIRFNV
jgi:hypothetical protein